MTDRPYDFMASEPEVYDLLVQFVAQWRARVGPADKADDQPYVAALRRLSEVLMQMPSTDVWGPHGEEERWRNAKVFCRLHGTVRGSDGTPYTGCDRLAWIGDKMLKAKYDLKDIWPEPGVWSSWFESSRRRH